MGLSGVEPLTSRLSGGRSNQLSYRPHLRLTAEFGSAKTDNRAVLFPEGEGLAVIPVTNEEEIRIITMIFPKNTSMIITFLVSFLTLIGCTEKKDVAAKATVEVAGQKIKVFSAEKNAYININFLVRIIHPPILHFKFYIPTSTHPPILHFTFNILHSHRR